MKDEEYYILLRLCRGEFSVPVVKRTNLQKSTVSKFGEASESLLVIETCITERMYMH